MKKNKTKEEEQLDMDKPEVEEVTYHPHLSRRGHSLKGRGVQWDVASVTHQIRDVPANNEGLVLKQRTSRVRKRLRPRWCVEACFF